MKFYTQSIHLPKLYIISVTYAEGRLETKAPLPFIVLNIFISCGVSNYQLSTIVVVMSSDLIKLYYGHE